MCWTHGLRSSRAACDGRGVTRRLRLQERAFTQRFHMPLMRHLARVRAHGLTELLVETDLSVGVALTKVGWRSRGYAARQFTHIVGMSPSSNRRTAIGQSLTETGRWPSATQGSPESKGPSRQECRDAVGEDLVWADVVRRVESRVGGGLVRVDGDALLV